MVNNIEFVIKARDEFSKELDTVNRKIQQLSKPLKPLQMWKARQKELNIELKKTEMLLNDLRVDQQIGAVGRVLKKSRQEVIGFNGNLLSILFLGMEMQRIFGGALKSIFEGYKKIIPENSKFNRDTTRLNANWEYFKFQLASALVGSKVFDVLINGAIMLIKKFQELSPTAKLFIVISLGILTAAGALFFFAGVIGLGIISLINLGVAFGITNTAALGFMYTLGKIFFWVGLIVGAFIIMKKMINNSIVEEGKKIEGVWNNLLAIGNTFIAGLANIFILAITGFLAFFTLIYDTWKFTLSSMGDIATSFGSAVKAALVAGLTGGFGAAKKAFLENFNVADIGETLSVNFTESFTNGTTEKLRDTAFKITDSINKWNSEYVNSLATDQTSPELQTLLSVNDMNQRGVSSTTVNNNFIVDSTALNGTQSGQSASKFMVDFMNEVNGDPFGRYTLG